MSLNTLFMEDKNFPDNWDVSRRVEAMYRKINFIKANKFMKEKKLISRYKRNLKLSEMFSTSYKKLIGGMVKDLMEIAFDHFPAEKLTYEKARGVDAFKLIIKLPATQTEVDRISAVLRAYPRGMMTFSTYSMRPYNSPTVTFNYNCLNLLTQNISDTSLTITELHDDLLKFSLELGALLGVDPPSQPKEAKDNPELEEPEEKSIVVNIFDDNGKARPVGVVTSIVMDKSTTATVPPVLTIGGKTFQPVIRTDVFDDRTPIVLKPLGAFKEVE